MIATVKTHIFESKNMSAVDRERNSIEIYEYKREIKLPHQKIIDKIKKKTKHRYQITLRDDKNPDVTKYSIFHFTRVLTDNNNTDILYYNIRVERDTLEFNNPNIFYHDICFTSKGYIIIAGMEFRKTILKYLMLLLHDGNYYLEPKFLNKKIMINFANKILVPKGINRMYRPRFHFSNAYRDRTFNDFTVNEIRCATEDKEYATMLGKCFYFDPIFKINNMYESIYPRVVERKSDTETNLKMNHDARLYHSKKITFDEWIKFIKKYLEWCA